MFFSLSFVYIQTQLYLDNTEYEFGLVLSLQHITTLSLILIDRIIQATSQFILALDLFIIHTSQQLTTDTLNFI